ncbi:MAG: PEP-CTERM sorting domain-containing protein [Anaerolineae bacterium]|nr:PEP-CTERM sorting domain-containing protein [Phycisphaerae bacterium]
MNHRIKFPAFCAVAVALFGASSLASARPVSTYEDLSEGFLGATFTHNGVTYRDVNNVSGFYADGEPFGPTDNGDQTIVENATLFYDGFPTYGSAINSLTFGNTFINGDNLSIGALASVWMDVAGGGSAASFDIAFYENGPWGGIVYHLDAVKNNVVVTSDTFTIAGPTTGRDNPTFQTMSVGGVEFDSLHLYATLNGNYTVPRGMIDNLNITPVPEPTSMAMIGIVGAGMMRRRQTRAR